MTEMHMWRVKLEGGAEYERPADHIKVDPSGVLIFYGAWGNALEGLAPGVWAMCERIDDHDD